MTYTPGRSCEPMSWRSPFACQLADSQNTVLLRNAIGWDLVLCQIEQESERAVDGFGVREGLVDIRVQKHQVRASLVLEMVFSPDRTGEIVFTLHVVLWFRTS